jgi:hypothetical protein
MGSLGGMAKTSCANGMVRDMCNRYVTAHHTPTKGGPHTSMESHLRAPRCAAGQPSPEPRPAGPSRRPRRAAPLRTPSTGHAPVRSSPRCRMEPPLDVRTTPFGKCRVAAQLDAESLPGQTADPSGKQSPPTSQTSTSGAFWKKDASFCIAVAYSGRAEDTSNSAELLHQVMLCARFDSLSRRRLAPSNPGVASYRAGIVSLYTSVSSSPVAGRSTTDATRTCRPLALGGAVFATCSAGDRHGSREAKEPRLRLGISSVQSLRAPVRAIPVAQRSIGERSRRAVAEMVWSRGDGNR